MTVRYLLILGIGHVLGDFYLQNDKLAKYKDREYKGVLLHAAEYYMALLLTMLPVFSADMILAATYAAAAHFAIDTAKYLFLKKKVPKSCTVFVADQCAHIVSIWMLVYVMECWNFSIGHLRIVKDVLDAFHYDAESAARWVLSILAIHRPANIFIQNFLGEYKPKADREIIRTDYKAGRKIGTIERLIMLIFLSKDQFAALGFILTAKSVARYDRITKDEKFAEYYLLGTLVSTLYVIVCRMLILV